MATSTAPEPLIRKTTRDQGSRGSILNISSIAAVTSRSGGVVAGPRGTMR